MKPTSIAPAALVLLLLSAGCGGAGDDVAGATPSASTGVGLPSPTSPTRPASPASKPPSSAPPSAGPSTAPSGGPGAAPEAFPAGTGVDSEQATGGPLSVVAVRVARQEGYDRVVFELKGKQPGQPGWRVEYTDDPRQDGSGDPVQVKGAAKLSVVITGVGIPSDTGVPETTADPTLPSDLGVVVDAQFSSNFEGQYGVFVGARAKTPFRVFRLSDPARVVVDLRKD